MTVQKKLVIVNSRSFDDETSLIDVATVAGAPVMLAEIAAGAATLSF